MSRKTTHVPHVLLDPQLRLSVAMKIRLYIFVNDDNLEFMSFALEL
jgi:hypothetical protein